ncbi:MAG: geranylgeranyl reductase family protein [Corynebacterium sp.]|nr:geranylgeranyl reductase family protein [Corynebacterium sp.]
MNSYELVIIGAGPAGSSAAIHAAQLGYTVALIDAADFPRDKTCGDGLTPRAMKELATLGLTDSLPYRNQGLSLAGFGVSVKCPWPEGMEGSASRRMTLDNMLFHRATNKPNVEAYTGSPVSDVSFHSSGSLSTVTLANGTVISGTYFIIADGVRSQVGKMLGRTWHRGTIYGIAARAYCSTPMADYPWIHSDLELREPDGTLQPGYGWIFPLGAEDGYANVGCGALSTAARTAQINTKKLLRHYVDMKNSEDNGMSWQFGAPENIASALLPMGGAVSNISGPNWILIGDAAACVNPLNGEGIDYALETARLGVGLIDSVYGAHGGSSSVSHLRWLWPQILRAEYGEAFSLARQAAILLTYPRMIRYGGPLVMRAGLMPIAARLMGNLVFEEDKDLIAKFWRTAGKAACRIDSQPLWG